VAIAAVTARLLTEFPYLGPPGFCQPGNLHDA
jgi:hypothetical protein